MELPLLESMDLALVKPVALPLAACEAIGPERGAEDDDAVLLSPYKVHAKLRCPGTSRGPPPTSPGTTGVTTGQREGGSSPPVENLRRGRRWPRASVELSRTEEVSRNRLSWTWALQ